MLAVKDLERFSLVVLGASGHKETWDVRTNRAVSRGELELFEQDLVAVRLQGLWSVRGFCQDDVRLVGIALCFSQRVESNWNDWTASYV